jgi:L-fuconolactonase
VPWPKEGDQIYRTILPRDFRAVAGPVGVTHAVIVEASPWLEDNQWVLDVIAGEPSILGLVGNLDLGSDEFPAMLDRFASEELFLGIRARGMDNAVLLGEPHLGHLRELANRGLSLDVLARGEGLEQIRRIALEVPQLRIVIDHLGHVPIDGGSPDATWSRAIAGCADGPNTYCKVSRVIEAAVNWPAPTDPEFYRPVLEHLWRCFGPERLLWGSNWPVAEKAGDYATTLAVVNAFLAERSERERRLVLSGTSREAYRWRPRSGEDG